MISRGHQQSVIRDIARKEAADDVTCLPQAWQRFWNVAGEYIAYYLQFGTQCVFSTCITSNPTGRSALTTEQNLPFPRIAAGAKVSESSEISSPEQKT